MKKILVLFTMVCVCFTMGLVLNTDYTYAAAHSHNYKVVKTKAATCTEKGYKQYKCKCGKTKKVVLQKKAHAYKVYKTKAATCTEKGAKYYKCKCGAKKTTTLAKKNHTIISSITAPTCTTEGKQCRSCTKCSYKTLKRIPVREHTYELYETIEPTCEMPGTEFYCCTFCGKQKEYQLDPLGHEMMVEYSSVRPDRCTTITCAEYSCANCEEEHYVSSSVSYSHSCMELAVHEPEGAIAGYTESICRRCGEIFIEPF